MKPLFNAARTGLAEIRAHKMRSVLSFLAIAAGSVVFIDSFASIFVTYDRLRKQKEVSGIARLKITQNRDETMSDPDEFKQPPVITYKDALDLKAKLPGLYMVSPESISDLNVLEYAGRRVMATLSGISPEWARRDFTYSLKGRFLNWRDMEEKLRVCLVIKKAIPPPMNEFDRARARQWDYTRAFDVLVSHNDLLDKTVKIDGITFTVVGILEELPESVRPEIILPRKQDYKILAPVTTLTHYGFLDENFFSMDVSVDTGDEMTFQKSLRLIENFLKVRFGSGNFFTIDNQMETINEAIEADIKASLMTIALGMLAFLAGGIGIMNVTLATVFARVKEIGIRRALGASRGDIMLQFIVEAAMLGLIGGVIGSAAGYLWGVQIKVMFGMDASRIQAWMPAVSILIATLTALLFAIYPAWVAAGLKPADALRAE